MELALSQACVAVNWLLKLNYWPYFKIQDQSGHGLSGPLEKGKKTLTLVPAWKQGRDWWNAVFCDRNGIFWHFYRPRSEGDNALGSVCLSVRPLVCLWTLSWLNRLTYDLKFLHGGAAKTNNYRQVWSKKGYYQSKIFVCVCKCGACAANFADVVDRLLIKRAKGPSVLAVQHRNLSWPWVKVTLKTKDSAGLISV